MGAEVNITSYSFFKNIDASVKFKPLKRKKNSQSCWTLREILKFDKIWWHLTYIYHTCMVKHAQLSTVSSMLILGQKSTPSLQSAYIYTCIYAFLYHLFSQREITRTIEQNTISVFHDLLHENIHDWRYLHTDRISQNITWHCFPVLNVCTSPTVQQIYL